MNSFIKGFVSIIGVILMIPVAIVIVALLCVTLIGGYIGAVITTWKWLGIAMCIIIGAIVVKWTVETVLGFFRR